MLRTLLIRLLVVAHLATLVGVLPVGHTSVGAVGSPWIDTSNRAAVIAAHQAEFSKTTPAINWTGNRSTCAPGTTSQAYRNAIFARVNYFRAMAGVPANVTENPTWSAMAQEAALMMSASEKLSHTPDSSSFSCYTSNGRTAAGSSDLYLGRTGPAAINGYIEDPGANNTRVGHRNWILHPTTNQMGTGDLPSTGGWASNSLWVFDNVFGAQPTLRESEGFVAWPNRGFVPGEVVFPRWSFSVRNGDFSSATVTMRLAGSTVGNTVVYRDGASNGAPFPIIVWEPAGIATSPAVDQTYSITITGARVNGVAKTFTYDVTIIGGQPGGAGGGSPELYEPFVAQAYLDFTGRAANTDEIDYWSGRLATGLSRLAFVEILSKSDAWIAGLVDDLYMDTLGRPADGAGRDYWAGRLRTGTVVAQVAASFYGSDEYVRGLGGSYEPWVKELYGVLLDRSWDDGGVAYWASQSGRSGSGVVAYRFYQSQESRESRVVALYQQFLGRNPDAGGLAYWAGVLQSGDDLRLAAFLASSNEYFDRAS
jgi:uncharacterized protein YkwD